MSFSNVVSFAGFATLCLLAWLIGGCRRPNWKSLIGPAGLSLIFGIFVFLVPATRRLLMLVNDLVLLFLGGSTKGAEFLLGPLALGPGRETASGDPSIGVVLAAQVLPAVIFFSALMAVFHHLGLIAPIVRFFGRVFHRGLDISGAEALSGSIHMFFGVETAAAIRPYLSRMTSSELLTVLATNLATVASTILGLYVIFLRDSFPQIAGHLVSASLLSIPTAVLAAKLILPETEVAETKGSVPPIETEERHQTLMAALAAGAWDGLKVAAGISTILIAVLGIVGILDAILAELGNLLSQSPERWSSAAILGWLFTPFAWLLGIDSTEISIAGRLLGQRLILTEVVSYQQLGELARAGALSPRTVLVLSYSLCGFAHVAGMGIALGGFGALAPDRREQLAGLAFKALAAATLATLMTGALAGIFYHGQTGLLGL